MIGSREQIFDCLHREALTVDELVERVGVSRTAVNLQLRQLLASGLVRVWRRPSQGMVGKPASLYEVVPGMEDRESRAYPGLLAGLIGELRERMGDDVEDVLEHTGRRLARQAALSSPPDFETGLRAAMALADTLGARTERIDDAHGVMVRNYRCPLGSAVRKDACMCTAMAAFFSEATGRPARAECLRGERLVCQYYIEAPAR
jgi:predicted ArsR family transcriptional regulator